MNDTLLTLYTHSYLWHGKPAPRTQDPDQDTGLTHHYVIIQCLQLSLAHVQATPLGQVQPGTLHHAAENSTLQEPNHLHVHTH